MSGRYREKAVFGIYWMTLVSAINIVLKFLIIVVLSRLLNAYEFGLVASIQIIISFAEIFWMMGIGPAIVQKKTLTDDDVSTGNTLNVAFGIGIYCLLLLFASPISNFVGIEHTLLLKVLSIVFVIHSISGVSEALLQREMEFRIIGLINTISLSVYGISACVLAFLGFGVWALIIAQILQVSTKAALVLMKRPTRPSIHINRDSAKSLLYFGTGFTLSRLFNNLAIQGDNFVVNKTLGSSALGFYNRAYQLLMVPTDVITTVMDKVLFPFLSKLQDRNDKLAYVYLNITVLIAVVACAITTFSFILGPEIVTVVLGDAWLPLVVPFQILILSLFFRMAYKVCDALVRSLGAVYKRLWVQIVYAITVILGAFIGKEWGVEGVAIATSIAIVLNYAIMTGLAIYLTKLKISLFFRYMTTILSWCFLLAVISYGISLTLGFISSALLKMFVFGIALLVIYACGFLILMKILPTAFREFFNAIVTTTFGKVMKKRQDGRTL